MEEGTFYYTLRFSDLAFKYHYTYMYNDMYNDMCNSILSITSMVPSVPWASPLHEVILRNGDNLITIAKIIKILLAD